SRPHASMEDDIWRAPRWTWLLWCAAALALYSSSLFLGLLSDDFVLAARARAWQLGPIHSDLFRPAPLLVWAILLTAGGGPTALHLFNVLVHGTVAFLTTRLTGGWRLSPLLAIAAGSGVLTFPASVEAVMWCAGVFDLTTTLFCVAAVLAARRYTATTSIA